MCFFCDVLISLLSPNQLCLFSLVLQPSQVLCWGQLGSEPPGSQRRAQHPPVPSGAGHGAVHAWADGHHQQLRGLSPPPYPSAGWGQPGSDKTASLSCCTQAAWPSTHEPMTHRASWDFISWLFFSFGILRNGANKIWMLQTIPMLHIHTTYPVIAKSGGVGVELQHATVERWPHLRFYNHLFWPSWSRTDKFFEELQPNWEKEHCWNPWHMQTVCRIWRPKCFVLNTSASEETTPTLCLRVMLPRMSMNSELDWRISGPERS